MNHAFSILFFLLSSMMVYGQNCSPDQQYADSTAGVYPAPVTANNPDGGINIPACQGAYYEFVLTVIVPDSITIDFNGFPVTLDIITASIPTEDAIQGLPEGLDYLCMPSDCVFPSDSSGCLLLYGTVDENAPAGDYPLSIQLEITLDGLGTQTFDFPGPQFPGSYDLTVVAPTDPDCTNNSAIQYSDNFSLYPNPVIQKEIYISGWEGKLKYQIYDATGRISLSGFTKNGRINLRNLNTGMYTLQLNDGLIYGRKKFIISN